MPWWSGSKLSILSWHWFPIALPSMAMENLLFSSEKIVSGFNRRSRSHLQLWFLSALVHPNMSHAACNWFSLSVVTSVRCLRTRWAHSIHGSITAAHQWLWGCMVKKIITHVQEGSRSQVTQAQHSRNESGWSSPPPTPKKNHDRHFLIRPRMLTINIIIKILK